MTKGTLLIKGKGGLGNRILSAVCGLVFADLTGRAPVIDWRDGSYAPEGQNAYPLLFQSPITLDCGEFDSRVAPVSPKIWSGHLNRTPQQMIDKFMPNGHSGPVAYRSLCTNLRQLETAEDIAVFWSYLPKFGRLRPHLRRDRRFSGRTDAQIIRAYLARYFLPNDRVAAAVDALAIEMESPSIGVHIRYTDRKVPLDRIKACLQAHLRRAPDTRIFLATDSAAVQAGMEQEFGQIYSHHKHLAEDGARLHHPNSTVAKQHEAENALIDMWQLSRCDRLIYSRHSTFSVTSAYLGAMTSSQLCDVDRFSPTVVAKRLIQYYA